MFGLVSFAVTAALVAGGRATCPTTSPPVWPDRFTLVQRQIRDDGANATVVTYYDWEAQVNLLIITNDDAEDAPTWDLELGTGHSYFFTPATRACRHMHFPVGILRRTWLEGASFLGRERFHNRDVLVWTKADFIDYRADAETCEPVSWRFHSMAARFDTILYAPNMSAPSAEYFQPPEFCHPDGLPGDRPEMHLGAHRRPSLFFGHEAS